MKKKMFVISMLVLALTLVFSTSAALAVKRETVGAQIMIYGDPISFPAGEPFHVQHGIVFGYDITERVGNEVALSKMTLDVDEFEIEPDYYDYAHYNFLPDPPPDYPDKAVIKLYTFNFPDGLERGTYTFVRRYYFTCQSFWDDGIPVECHNPAELIENPYWEQSLVVNFE
jgi:hypothetical protein